MSNELLLEAKNVTKSFFAHDGRKLLACDNISLNVYEGKTLGIVGESGCGKSTFVKMIVQMFQPTEGAIIYRGKDITKMKGEELRQSRKKIQMVFQDPALSLNPKMRVIDIVTEPLLNFGMIKSAEKYDVAKKLLSMVELPETYLYRFPHSMSGGQRQRIGIARALALQPEIIVCDEATCALDVSVQDKIVNLLVKLQKEKNISFIFICHDIALVQSLAHEIAVMYLGNIMEIVPGDKLWAEAEHPYSKALMKSVFSINPDCNKEIEGLEGDIPSPLDIPEGCPFQNRCKICEDICRKEKPVLRDFAEGHKIACHLVSNSR